MYIDYSTDFQKFCKQGQELEEAPGVPWNNFSKFSAIVNVHSESGSELTFWEICIRRLLQHTAAIPYCIQTLLQHKNVYLGRAIASTFTHCCTILLQHTAAPYCCNALLQRTTATYYCHTLLQHTTATHYCNTLLQHTIATHYYNTPLQHTYIYLDRTWWCLYLRNTTIHCFNKLLQHTAAIHCCNRQVSTLVVNDGIYIDVHVVFKVDLEHW